MSYRAHLSDLQGRRGDAPNRSIFYTLNLFFNKRSIEISYMYVIKKRMLKDGEKHMHAKDGKSVRFSRKSTFARFWDAFGHFLGAVKGYKRRGGREKENTTQCTHIEAMRKRR